MTKRKEFIARASVQPGIAWPVLVVSEFFLTLVPWWWPGVSILAPDAPFERVVCCSSFVCFTGLCLELTFNKPEVMKVSYPIKWPDLDVLVTIYFLQYSSSIYAPNSSRGWTGGCCASLVCRGHVVTTPAPCIQRWSRGHYTTDSHVVNRESASS